MSQSRFSIVLVGVSALLRRPLVSRLRPADGERSSWVVFTARVGRFESGFRSAVGLRAHCFRFSACAASELPLGEFVLPPSVSEITAGRVRSSAFRFGNCPPRVGLRAHCFRFSACTDSEIAARRVGLRVHGFRFSARIASELPSASWFFCLLFRRLPLGELVLLPSVSEFAARRVGLRAHGFRFSARTASELPSASWRFRSAGWPSGSRLLLFGMRRSAPPRRRREDRRSTTTRQLFHFKTLIPTC